MTMTDKKTLTMTLTMTMTVILKSFLMSMTMTSLSMSFFHICKNSEKNDVIVSVILNDVNVSVRLFRMTVIVSVTPKNRKNDSAKNAENCVFT